MATEKTPIFDIDTKPAVNSIANVRKALKEIQNAMTGMEEGSDEFLAAANKAGELRHQLEEIQNATRGASNDFGDMVGNITKAGAGITGAFLTASAAMSMLGVESEEVTQSIKTMQNMMAMTQGLASIDEGIKALDKLKNSITGTTIASKALRAVLQPKAIMAITLAITAATLAFKKYKQHVEEAAKMQKTFTSIEEKGAADSAKSIANIKLLVKAAHDETLSLDERKKAIEELNRIIPEYNGKLDETTQKYEENTQAINDYIQSLLDKATAEAAQEEVAEKIKDIAQKQVKLREKIAKEAQKQWDEMVKTAGQAYMDLWYSEGPMSEKFLNRIYTDGNDAIGNLKREIEEGQQEIAEIYEKFRGIINKNVIESNEDTHKSSEKAKKDTLKEVDLILQEIDLKYANLELLKEQDEEYGKSKKALEDYKAIQEEELAHLKDLQKEGKATAVLVVNMLTAIAKTDNDIKHFGEDKNAKTDFEKKIEEIEAALAQADYIYDASKQAQDDEITRLTTIIDLEKQRLEAMRANNEEGTTSWYQQLSVILDYEKQLKDVTKSTITWQDTTQNAIKVSTEAINGIGNLLGTLSSQQDTNTKEGFEKSKKLDIAQATMSMFTGIATALSGAFTTKSGPWDIALAAIQAASIAASGIAEIANIKKQKFDSSSTSGATATTTSAANTVIAPVQYTKDIQGASIEGAIKDTKVYVTETDIRNTGNRVSVQENENRY